MATIVNTPASSHEHVVHEDTSSGSSFSMVVGAIILLAILAIVFFYGLPLLRTAAAPQAPQVNIPDKVNVDVNTPNAPAPK